MEAKKFTKPGRRAYRRYDANFKAEAVKQLERGTSVTELVESLGVKSSLLHNWKSQAKQPAAMLEEVKRLTKQLKAREQEIDILKKALRIFSQTD